MSDDHCRLSGVDGVMGPGGRWLLSVCDDE
jgi:hypothetical protein